MNKESPRTHLDETQNQNKAEAQNQNQNQHDTGGQNKEETQNQNHDEHETQNQDNDITQNQNKEETQNQNKDETQNQNKDETQNQNKDETQNQNMKPEDDAGRKLPPQIAIPFYQVAMLCISRLLFVANLYIFICHRLRSVSIKQPCFVYEGYYLYVNSIICNSKPSFVCQNHAYGSKLSFVHHRLRSLSMR
jgi:hypothetical protein